MKVTGKKLRDRLIAKYGSPKSLDDLAKIVVSEVNEREPLQGFAWDVRYNPRVRASHSSPHNTKPNFTLTLDRPTHYRGFEGRVWIAYKTRPRGWDRDAFTRSLTYLGSGGSGDYGISWPREYKDYRCGYDYKIWLDDWPDILTYIDSRIVLHNLVDHQSPFEERHEFNWRAESMPIEELLAIAA